MTTSQERLNPQKYRSKEYWEERFQKESKRNEEGAHEWFSSYEAFKSIVTSICPPEITRLILVPGNGNSSLCYDLLTDYPESIITGGDYSPSVVECMRTKYSAQSDRLKWIVQDITNIQQDGVYDMILEKGVIDALVAGSKNPFPSSLDAGCLEAVEKSVLSIRKALAPGGVFLSISFASSMIRSPLLRGVFEVKLHTFNESWTGFQYTVYECRNTLTNIDFHKHIKNDLEPVVPVELPENDLFNIDCF